MPEYSVAQLLDHVNSSYSKPGNERVRQIAERLIADIYRIMVDFNVSHAELWSFFTWLNDLGTAKQAGLLGAGIGLERLLDILADEADQHAQRAPGTPRAIEGPLYIPHAPLSTHEARLGDFSKRISFVMMLRPAGLEYPSWTTQGGAPGGLPPSSSLACSVIFPFGIPSD
jgi:catechol 1,2-dioxygenase